MNSPGLSEEQNLCSRCQAIKFDEIFNRRHLYHGTAEHVLDLGPVQSSVSACALCNHFVAMANVVESTTSCTLLRTSYKSAFLDPDVWDDRQLSMLDDTMLLFVEANHRKAAAYNIGWGARRSRRLAVTKGYLSSLQPTRGGSHIGFRPISPASFDLDFIKDSISYCSANHSSHCRPQIRDPPSFFRIIDCKTRKVIEAPPGCGYLALSYPKVINDSIDVTLKLMYRYLWVDRYCIDQSDDIDKHRQIRQMDVIYTNAEATIIAAAGDNPEYGLPGVNGTLRKQQLQLRARGHLLISTLTAPSWIVNNSKWVTRGWTYQESILSKRRILFTDDQVLFECNRMHRVESQIFLLDGLHTEDKTTFKLEMVNGVFTYKIPGLNLIDIIGFLADFSKRELRYPVDAIDAMQGIFQVFAKARFPVYHIEEVPVIPATSGAFIPEDTFIRGLSWYHTKRTKIGFHESESLGKIPLLWTLTPLVELSRPKMRCPEFPSWSWAGWTGQLEDKFMYEPHSHLTHLGTRIVHIEGENGDLQKFPTKEDWPDFQSKIATMRLKIIHVRGHTLRRTVVHSQDEPLS